MHIVETLTNPQLAVGTAGGVTILNVVITTLPTIINVLTILYLTGLIIHKGMQIYKELKLKRVLNDPTS